MSVIHEISISFDESHRVNDHLHFFLIEFELYSEVNINFNIIIDHPYDLLFHEDLFFILEHPVFNNKKIKLIMQTNFINLESTYDMIKFKYNNFPLSSFMVSIALDTDAVMNLLSKKYDFPLFMYVNLNFNKELKYTCDANYILLPACKYNDDKLLTQEELQGCVDILNKNKIPFKFTIDVNINHDSEIGKLLSRMTFIAQLLKSNNGLGTVFYINNHNLSNFDSGLENLRYLKRALELAFHLQCRRRLKPTTAYNAKEDYVTKSSVSMLSNKSNPTKGLSVTSDKYSNTTWIDIHVYNSFKIVDTVLPYLIPPSCGVLYNLGENNRVCLETLHLKSSFEFKRKFIQARLIDDEIFVTQEFFSEKDHNITVFCAWLERNPHIICTWQLDFKGDIINVGNYLFDDTNFKLPTIAEVRNPNLQPSFEVSPLQSIQMNASEHRQYILDTLSNTLENYGKIELISDEDYDDSRSILAYRVEFDSAKIHFDILLTSLALTTMNLHKDLLIELKSLWEAAINVVSKFEVDQALPILEWLPAMWMQVIGCPDDVRTREELFYILYEILSKPDLDWTQEAVVKSLTDKKFRNKFAQWIGRHIFNHCENIERDLWEISEPIDWNSYLCIEDNKVTYKHLHYVDGEYKVTNSTKLVLKVVDQPADPKTELLSFCICDSWDNLTLKIVAENIFNHMQDVLKLNQNCSFLGHCTTEESIIKMSKYGMSPYAGFGNKMSCGHGMYFFKMSKTDKKFDQLFESSSNDSSEIDENGVALNTKNNDITKEFQGFIYAMSTRVKHIEQLAVMLFLIEYEEKLKAYDTTELPLSLRKCYCNPVFGFPEHNEYIECNIKGRDPTTKDTINALNLIRNDDVERFNIFALISGVVDFNKIPNGVFRGNIFDGLCNITKSTNFPPEAMPTWVENKQQFKLWKNACSSLPLENYRRMFGDFDTRGEFQIYKDRPEEMWEYVFVSSCALQELLNHSVIKIAFIDSDAKSTTKEFCDRTSNLNEYHVMDEEWLNEEMINDKKKHPNWTLRLRCNRNLGECCPK